MGKKKELICIYFKFANFLNSKKKKKYALFQEEISELVHIVETCGLLYLFGLKLVSYRYQILKK